MNWRRLVSAWGSFFRSHTAQDNIYLLQGNGEKVLWREYSLGDDQVFFKVRKKDKAFEKIWFEDEENVRLGVFFLLVILRQKVQVWSRLIDWFFEGNLFSFWSMKSKIQLFLFFSEVISRKLKIQRLFNKQNYAFRKISKSFMHEFIDR